MAFHLVPRVSMSAIQTEHDLSVVHAFLSIRLTFSVQDDGSLLYLEQDVDGGRVRGAASIYSQAVVDAHVRPRHSRHDHLSRGGVGHFGWERAADSEPLEGGGLLVVTAGCRTVEDQVCALHHCTLSSDSHIDRWIWWEIYMYTHTK